MKKLTQKQLNEVKSIEAHGDELMSNPTFNKCMDAIDKYIEAQDLLVKYASDKNASGEYGELKTECLEYKVWHNDLIKKMSAAQEMLSKPSMLRS